MSNAHDRRAPGTARIPFDAMVEVGGALGPSFEAQAVNLSEEGMSLRTAYLPEVGQPVMCRFDAGQGMAVVAAGEVLWKDDMGNGGEFGIRFTNLDGASTVALQRILGMAEDGQLKPESGRKVRLHIEGLASPMRARIKDQAASGVTAYSELGFLQMGKPLELEDAMSGARRPASIDRVQVEVDEGSRIPQLVVSLRYEDASSLAGMEVPAADAGMHASENAIMTTHEEPAVSSHYDAPAAEPPMASEQMDAPKDDGSVEEESNKLKSAFARNAAKVTPAIMGWAKRAKVAAALLAAKARRKSETGDDVEIPMRRTTAPAPGGGLHATGRRVVRGSVPDATVEETAAPAKKNLFKMTKRKAAVIGSIGIATVLVAIALKKPAPAPQLASVPPADSAATLTTTGATTAAPATTNAAPAATNAPAAPPADPLAAAAMANAKPGKAVPFTNGPVGAHPTIIKIKMDGPVEGIQGATQPTGFTIVTPNRKAADPSASLASKDPRLEGIRIANESGGAELNVTFKEGVPNYLVRAHGDTLELVLAKASGPNKAEASTGSSKKGKKGKRH